jgi:glycosyltransferase involved in cell wall biosynthesis
LTEHHTVARVLITGFCAVPGPSRASVQLRHVVRALSPSHTVDLLVLREGDQGYVERSGQVRILRVPTHDNGARDQIQTFQRALRRQLDGADYDVVHCRDGWSGVTVLEAKPRLGYAVVYDLTRAPLEVSVALDADLEAERQRDDEACLLAADLVLVPTEPARRYAAARGRPDRVVLAPPGVDVDRFDWDDAPAAGPARILYAGAIEPGRGVRVLLRAMVEVVRHVEARLVLAGPIAPGFDAVLRSSIAELGLGDRVEVRGPIDHDDMPALIASAIVCVAPSASELHPRPIALYPTKLLEYLACRRAVVAARRGTTAMLIDHGREGLLFAPGDAADLARKVVRLVEDQPLREKLAAAGYERVRKEFTASSARRAVRAAYAQMSSRPALRDRFLAGRTATDDAGRPGTGSSDPIGGGAGGSDDDFEATVFEEGLPGGEAHLSSLEAALSSLDDGSRPGEIPVTEDGVAVVPAAGDETAERALVDPRVGHDSGNWPAVDDWVVAPIREASQPPDWEALRVRAESEDEGTPLDVVPAPPPLPSEPPAFASGEIDVPTPRPELEPEAFTAASTLLGSRD